MENSSRLFSILYQLTLTVPGSHQNSGSVVWVPGSHQNSGSGEFGYLGATKTLDLEFGYLGATKSTVISKLLSRIVS